jgi:hypothetical protein
MNELDIKVKLEVSHGELYHACYEAWRWAETGPWETGSNYWMTMFTDKLNEELTKNIKIVKVEGYDDL